MIVEVILSGLLAGGAHAARPTYDLSVRLTRAGKSLSAPHLFVREGEVGGVRSGFGDFIEVRITEGRARGSSGLYLEFLVGTQTADGRRRVLSRPRILAVENEPATITVGDGGTKTISLRAVARRALR